MAHKTTLAVQRTQGLKQKKVSVLDLDGTVVPEHAWVPLVVAATSLAFAFHFPFPVACIFLVCLFIPVRPLRDVRPPVFVNTARPWPFVSPITLWAIGVPFSHVYFRASWDKHVSKIINMRRIQDRVGCEDRSLVVLYENEAETLSAVQQAGYTAIETHYLNKSK